MCHSLCVQELVHWQTMFKEFYSKHYSTYRQLVWQHSMSTAMLRANFPKGVKELSVSLVQALVLLLFNDNDELTYEAVKEQLGMKDDKELQRTLLSLSVGKVNQVAGTLAAYVFSAKGFTDTQISGATAWKNAEQTLWGQGGQPYT